MNPMKSGLWLMLSLIAACGQPVSPSSWEADSAKIVDVPNTPVERQTIGNCWVYAHAGWAGSLHLQATGESLDLSESYWSYMHWFQQLTGQEDRASRRLSTGGDWTQAQELISRYGLMKASDFVPEDAKDERSARQASALLAVERALQDGELQDPEVRADRVRVREILDAAWGLDDGVRAALDRVFGKGLETSFADGAQGAGTQIISAQEFAAQYVDGAGKRIQTTLDRALRDWRSVRYPTEATFQRDVLRQMQRALHAAQPVMMSWMVDFNAFERAPDSPLVGSFNLGALNRMNRPGTQGGHMTVLEDYQAIVPVGRELSEQVTVAPRQWLTLGPYELALETRAEVEMTGTGDADLYLRVGEPPTAAQSDCRSLRFDSTEACSVQGRTGRLYVSIVARKRTSQVQVKIRIADSSELLQAGRTLDPSIPTDQARLQAALAEGTRIVFLRVKNSWGGAQRTGYPFARGPTAADGTQVLGYHDLYLDYLNGPIPDASACQGALADCKQTLVPLQEFILPPGF